MPTSVQGPGTFRITATVSPKNHADLVHSQWLIDVSSDLPSAQLDGFDVSEEQYPCKAWLPSHISLSHLDITKEIPSRLEGVYDLVHVQLFLCVVQKDGPTAILKEMYKLLSASSLPSGGTTLIAHPEPGGYLQWVEYDPISFKVVSPDLSLKQNANEKHVQIIRGPEDKATELVSQCICSDSAISPNC